MIDSGVNVNARDEKGNTALSIALECWREEVYIKTLLEAGADIRLLEDLNDYE